MFGEIKFSVTADAPQLPPAVVRHPRALANVSYAGMIIGFMERPNGSAAHALLLS